MGTKSIKKFHMTPFQTECAGTIAWSFVLLYDVRYNRHTIQFQAVELIDLEDLASHQKQCPNCGPQPPARRHGPSGHDGAYHE